MFFEVNNVPHYVNSLLLRVSWTGTMGQAAEVQYSFDPTALATSQPFYWNNIEGYRFSAEQELLAKEALQDYANIANITFVEASSLDAHMHGNISYNYKQNDGNLALTYTFPDPDTPAVDNTEVAVFEDLWLRGDAFAKYALLHEFGHMLGLSHPFSGEAILDDAQDNISTTVMSYDRDESVDVNDANPPVTPMIYDIAAIQQLYGANHSYNAGDSEYVLDGSVKAMTFWDGGGIDTLNTRDFVGDAIIDLNEGIDNVTRVGGTRSWNAFNANIENAKTGAGNDIVYGNGLSNFISGGSGNDGLFGNLGNDLIGGNAGSDDIFGGPGDDTVRGGRDNDVVHGEEGNDDVRGNIGNDTIYGSSGNDYMRGGQDQDQVYGNSGNDTLYGDKGDDSVYGGDGDDTVCGGSGNDKLYGEIGTDVLCGDEGFDEFHFTVPSGWDIVMDFTQGEDHFVLSTEMYSNPEAVMSHIGYGDGHGHIDLGNGNGILVLDVAVDSLEASDFIII